MGLDVESTGVVVRHSGRDGILVLNIEGISVNFVQAENLLQWFAIKIHLLRVGRHAFFSWVSVSGAHVTMTNLVVSPVGPSPVVTSPVAWCLSAREDYLLTSLGVQVDCPGGPQLTLTIRATLDSDVSTSRGALQRLPNCLIGSGL